MCVEAHWWGVLVACVVKPALLSSRLVLYQWSPPWTWRLWWALWKAGRRTRSSSPARTASACHPRPRKPARRRRGFIFSSSRASSSTITSVSSVILLFSFAQALKFNLQASCPLKLFTNLSSPLQASYWRLWQMFLPFHSLWGVQKEEKVTSSWSRFDKLHLNVTRGVTGYNVTWLMCFPRTRTYTVPDPPGLFDGHVWPMYLKHRKEMENNCDRLGRSSHFLSSGTKYPRAQCQNESRIFKSKDSVANCWLLIGRFSGQSTLTGWHQRTISTTKCMKAFRTPCWTLYR